MEILNGAESEPTASSGSMARKVSKGTKTERFEEVPGQIDRLKRLRKAFGYQTSTAFAAYLDIGYVRWNAFENGAPLSREVAFLLVRKCPGVSLDWLYFGKIEALPLELARRLGEFETPGKRKTD